MLPLGVKRVDVLSVVADSGGRFWGIILRKAARISHRQLPEWERVAGLKEGQAPSQRSTGGWAVAQGRRGSTQRLGHRFDMVGSDGAGSLGI